MGFHEKEKEKEEAELKLEEQEELNSLWAVPVERRTHQQMQRITYLLLNRGAKKKSKKRRKNKLPKTSSSRGPAHRRQRQWLTRSAGFPGDVPLRDVFPSASGRLVMLCIMAGMDQKCFFKFVDNPGSGMCRVGFTGYDAPCVMFPSGVAMPKMLHILACMDQKDRCSGIYMAGIACDYAPRAVFSSLVHKPLMLGVMADMNPRDSCPRHTGNWIFWEMTSTTVDTCTASVYGACEEAHIFPGLSPCSALSLVRQRRHAVRQSTRLPGRISGLSKQCRKP